MVTEPKEVGADGEPAVNYDLTNPEVAEMAQAAPAAAPDHPLIMGRPTPAMTVEKDVRIRCGDGSELYGDVFRPAKEGTFPVLLTVGPYGKDIPFELHWPYEYQRAGEHSPYMTIETVNPESWVADGYAVVRVDQTGTGKSPGIIDVWSPRDTDHFVDTIGWCGTQPWSSGAVGLIGISYYSATQLAVAARRPEHLAAIVPWEVGHDLYRELARHGGILSNGFTDFWFHFWVVSNQYGRTELPESELAANRVDFPAAVRRHDTLDDYWRERIADVSRIQVPLFTAGNWAGTALTLRSHIELYQRAASEHKWLRIHTGGHIEPFYEPASRQEQKRFLDRFLKGADNGQDDVPPIHLAVRRGRDVTWRYENEWPLARTRWTDWHLDAATMRLSVTPPAADAGVDFDASPDPNLGVPVASYNDVLRPGGAPAGATARSVTFTTLPFEQDTELTGPLALTLTVSTTGSDADLFVTVRNLAPDGTEITVDGMDNPRTPVTGGWLRLSHRRLDPARSSREQPVHAHTDPEPVAPGQATEVVIDVGPTSMVFERGHRLALEIGSHDLPGAFPLIHNDAGDRVVGGTMMIHTGPAVRNALVVPVVPAE